MYKIRCYNSIYTNYMNVYNIYQICTNKENVFIQLGLDDNIEVQ